MATQPSKQPRLRGREITRLEALSDAVFGFAATLGFIAVFTCLSLLYRHAGARWKELELDEPERLEARAWFHHYLIFVAVGCLSIVIVLTGAPLWISGVIYALIGPLCHWNGRVARRRVKELEQRLAA